MDVNPHRHKGASETHGRNKGDGGHTHTHHKSYPNQPLHEPNQPKRKAGATPRLHAPGPFRARQSNSKGTGNLMEAWYGHVRKENAKGRNLPFVPTRRELLKRPAPTEQDVDAYMPWTPKLADSNDAAVARADSPSVSLHSLSLSPKSEPCASPSRSCSVSPLPLASRAEAAGAGVGKGGAGGIGDAFAGSESPKSGRAECEGVGGCFTGAGCCYISGCDASCQFVCSGCRTALYCSGCVGSGQTQGKNCPYCRHPGLFQAFGQPVSQPAAGA